MSDSSTSVAAYDRHVRTDRAMIYSALAAGVAAGLLAAPGFLLLTPLVVLWLVWRSKRATPPKFEMSACNPTQMPMHIELAVHDTVAQLPSGDARRLLGDVIRQARPLFASLGA